MADSNTSQIITFLVAGGGAGAVVATLRIVFERKKIGADATEVVTRAARELVDPLRQELENERKSNSEEIARERAKVASLRRELDAAIAEAQELHRELAAARAEVAALWRERMEDHRLVEDLRRRVAELENARGG